MKTKRQKLKNAMLRIITYGTGKAIKIKDTTIVCGYCYNGWIYPLKKGNQIFCRSCGKISNLTKQIDREMD